MDESALFVCAGLACLFVFYFLFDHDVLIANRNATLFIGYVVVHTFCTHSTIVHTLVTIFLYLTPEMIMCISITHTLLKKTYSFS